MAKATVTAIITPDEHRATTICLTLRNISPFKGSWCLPGGHIDQYETVHKAVRREVLEETGLSFTSPSFLGWFDEIFPEYGFHAVVLAFFGTGTGKFRHQPEEVCQISWFGLEEALDMPLAFNHKQILQRYAQHLESTAH